MTDDSDRTRDGPPRRPVITPRVGSALFDLDEDALARALVGRLDDRILETAGHRRQSFDPTRIAQHLRAFLDIGEAVIEQGEHVGADLLAQAVTGAEVLVDPDLHGHCLVTYLSALGCPATS